MNEGTYNQLEDSHTLSSFKGKALVSLDAGRKIGTVEDILIDPGEMRINGIVTSKGGFLRSSETAIKAEEISLWGEDVILVHRSDAARKKEDLPGLENCLSAYDSIFDRDVISLEGDRLGQMEDLLINPDGKLSGFSVNRVRNGLADILQHEKKEIHQLPLSTMHSFGKDVLILDLDRVREAVPMSAVIPEETITETRVEQNSFDSATGRDVDETETRHDDTYFEDQQEDQSRGASL